MKIEETLRCINTLNTRTCIWNLIGYHISTYRKNSIVCISCHYLINTCLARTVIGTLSQVLAGCLEKRSSIFDVSVSSFVIFTNTIHLQSGISFKSILPTTGLLCRRTQHWGGGAPPTPHAPLGAAPGRNC